MWTRTVIRCPARASYFALPSGRQPRPHRAATDRVRLAGSWTTRIVRVPAQPPVALTGQRTTIGAEPCVEILTGLVDMSTRVGGTRGVAWSTAGTVGVCATITQI